MAYYRSLTKLDAGHNNVIDEGIVFNERRLSSKAITILAEMGRIAEVSFPPLDVIPGWKVRAAKVKEISTQEFLDAPNNVLAVKMKTKPDTIEAWKAEILRWMATPPKAG
ncbi:MAG: hypothetical protein PHV98_00735 [Candidatus Omnitrophica bacterium]|nr:hypothetical protein [Candidatus Omnitrophota bacterium]